MQDGTAKTDSPKAKAIASASSEAEAIRGAKSYMRAHELSASRVSPFLWAKPKVRFDGVLKEDVDAPHREEEYDEDGGGEWQDLEGLQTRRCARQMDKQGAGRKAFPRMLLLA